MRKRPDGYYSQPKRKQNRTRRGRSANPRSIKLALIISACILALVLVIWGICTLITSGGPAAASSPTPDASLTPPSGEPVIGDDDIPADAREYENAKYMPQYTDYEDLSGVELIEKTAPQAGGAIDQTAAQENAYNAFTHFFGVLSSEHPQYEEAAEQDASGQWLVTFKLLDDTGAQSGISAHITLRADGLLYKIEMEYPVDLPPDTAA